MKEIRALGPGMTNTPLRRAEEAWRAPWISRFSVMALRECEAFDDAVAHRLEALRLHMRTPGIADGTRIGDQIDRYFEARGRWIASFSSEEVSHGTHVVLPLSFLPWGEVAVEARVVLPLECRFSPGEKWRSKRVHTRVQVLGEFARADMNR